MDTPSLILVYVSMLWFLGAPLFWIARHFIFLNFRINQMQLRIVAYAVMIIFDIAIYFALLPYIDLVNPLPVYAAFLGWVLIVLWAVLELWSRVLLMRSVKKSSTTLISSGPYALVRHPIFLAALIFNFGAYLVSGSIIPLAVFIEWIILIKPLADAEDEELAVRLEEKYLQYKKKVPQLLPKLK